MAHKKDEKLAEIVREERLREPQADEFVERFGPLLDSAGRR